MQIIIFIIYNDQKTANAYRMLVRTAALPSDRKNRPRPCRAESVCKYVLIVYAYRCSTRSLISWVRPWFQNWVPM